MIDFLKDESGLNVGNNELCVCGACDLSVRQAMKSRDKGEPYQLRWLKGKKVSVCCVPSCSSVDIKAEKHDFTWEVICDSIEIASIRSPRDTSLCTKHYQQVYRTLIAKSDACKSVVCCINTVVRTLCLAQIPRELNLTSGIQLHLVGLLKTVIKYVIPVIYFSIRCSSQMYACCPVRI